MQPIHLMDLAWRHAQWASVRQAAISGNIANADTPGYLARDVEPFQSNYDQFALRMAATSPMHFGGTEREPHVAAVDRAETWDIKHSGNTVSLDAEMIKANTANRDLSLDMNIVRSFNRMLSSSLR